MKLILNEKLVLDKALKEGIYDKKKPTNTIRLLIKHFYIIGQNKDQAMASVEDFMTKNFEGYNQVKWQKLLNKMIKDLQNNIGELFVVNNIKISSNELNAIKSINNNRMEKLAFVLLVYAKIYNQMNGNQSNWINSELKDIFSDTKMAIGSTEQGKMIHKLKELGLLDISKRVDCTNIKILFVDENDVTIEINDFRDFVYEYLRWNGEKIINCENCNILVLQTNNKTKYCKACAKEVKNEQNKSYYNLGK
jgi:hypothetical protein